MSMVVQHNMQAANANRMLGITSGAQAKSTEKLSSGYKINRAADDAAGLTISEKMRKQIRGLDKASSNAQDGVSSVQTAEGALTEVHSMLQRMNELAVQSSNGTNSSDDRQAIQDEVDQLTTEIDRVAETTKFNEIYLLKGDNSNTKNVYMKGHDAGLKGTLTDGAKSATFTMDALQAGDKYTIAGKEYTIKELLKELKKDEMFYEESGGGVTLSGGEVMCMDMDYIEELVKQLHRQGITVDIDTSGYAPYENFKRILPYIDTFLYDIKAMDNEVHKKWIGTENTIILENLKKLSADGAKIYIRIPTIEGVNADEESMKAVIKWLTDEKIKVAQVNLLPYHNTGSSKYSRLECTYDGEAFFVPSDEKMKQLSSLFTEAGFLKVKIGG